jgi:DNA gyrase subunit A
MSRVGELPDVRDGLGRAGRRLLLLLGDRYVRSDKVVSDAAEYETLAGLAQDFRQRYPLVRGNGNFGSPDGDPPADARYTEARLAPIARELPRFPNLLVNGSDTIPPHNLREAAAPVIACAEDPEIDVPELMAHMPGPDFPTGGVIVDPACMLGIYRTGIGSLSLRPLACRGRRARGDGVALRGGQGR